MIQIVIQTKIEPRQLPAVKSNRFIESIYYNEVDFSEIISLTNTYKHYANLALPSVQVLVHSVNFTPFQR